MPQGRNGATIFGASLLMLLAAAAFVHAGEEQRLDSRLAADRVERKVRTERLTGERVRTEQEQPAVVAVAPAETEAPGGEKVDMGKVLERALKTRRVVSGQ